MKIESGTIHQTARCLDCGKDWGDYRTARKEGYAHAKKTGHEVHVETARAIIYNSKSKTKSTP